jgi:hypothetical protein
VDYKDTFYQAIPGTLHAITIFQGGMTSLVYEVNFRFISGCHCLVHTPDLMTLRMYIHRTFYNLQGQSILREDPGIPKLGLSLQNQPELASELFGEINLLATFHNFIFVSFSKS